MVREVYRFRSQRVHLPDGTKTHTVFGPKGVVEPADRYLTFLTDLGRSPNTIRAYACDLALYFDYLDRRSLDWGRVGMPDMAAFAADLRGTNRARPQPKTVLLSSAATRRAPSSSKRAFTAVFGLYDFNPETGVAKALQRSRQQNSAVRSPGTRTLKSVVTPVVHTTLKSHLEPEDLIRVVSNPRRLRDRLLLGLMGFNGLRIGAGLGLRHEDISVRRGEVRIIPRDDNANDARAKRRSALVLPFHADLGRLYVEYLEREYGNRDSDYVFVNLWAGQVGSPMTYDTARSLVDRTSRRTGVPFTAHMLRHTFATLARRGGASMESVSELFGHSSVDVTKETYIPTTVEDLRRVLDLIDARRALS